MRFEELYCRQQVGRLTQEEMAEVLNIDVRTARRWTRRFEEEGLDGLIDRRIGQISSRRAPVDQVMRVESLYRERYAGFNAKHFHEKLTKVHHEERSYTWTKRVLQRAGLIRKAKRRGAHRKRRERRALVGMMLHQDGSRHPWLPAEHCDLIVTMDDADNTIIRLFWSKRKAPCQASWESPRLLNAMGFLAACMSTAAATISLPPRQRARWTSIIPLNFIAP